MCAGVCTPRVARILNWSSSPYPTPSLSHRAGYARSTHASDLGSSPARRALPLSCTVRSSVSSEKNNSAATSFCRKPLLCSPAQPAILRTPPVGLGGSFAQRYRKSGNHNPRSLALPRGLSSPSHCHVDPRGRWPHLSVANARLARGEKSFSARMLPSQHLAHPSAAGSGSA